MAKVNGYEVQIEKPELKLVGQDGNAFAILGRAKRAMREAGWDRELQEEVLDEAISGNYDNLIQIMLKYFDVE